MYFLKKTLLAAVCNEKGESLRKRKIISEGKNGLFENFFVGFTCGSN